MGVHTGRSRGGGTARDGSGVTPFQRVRNVLSSRGGPRPAAAGRAAQLVGLEHGDGQERVVAGAAAHGAGHRLLAAGAAGDVAAVGVAACGAGNRARGRGWRGDAVQLSSRAAKWLGWAVHARLAWAPPLTNPGVVEGQGQGAGLVAGQHPEVEHALHACSESRREGGERTPRRWRPSKGSLCSLTASPAVHLSSTISHNTHPS